MRKLLLLIVLVALSTLSFAQNPDVKAMQQQAERNVKKEAEQKEGWTKGGIFSLNLAQGGSRNWAAGAEKFSLSIAAYVNLFANKKWGRNSWDNSIDLGYALVNTTSQGVRKNDDRIDIFSKYGYALNKTVSLSGVFNFRSQFADGFNYQYLGKDTLKKRISGLFAPAYITLAPGLEWKPTSYFSVFLSPVSARWVIVTNAPYSYRFQGGEIPAELGGGQEKSLAANYGVDPTREVDFQLGAYASVNFNKEIMKNIVFKTRLDLYSNYLKPGVPDASGIRTAHPEKVDVYWTNVLAMKVNKWISVTYNFDFIYDDDIRQFGPNKDKAGAQLRSLLGVGISAKF